MHSKPLWGSCLDLSQSSTQHRPTFIYVPVRSCAGPAGYQRAYRVCKPACEAGIPILFDAVKESSGKGISSAYRVGDLHFEAGDLAIRTLLKDGAAALAERDAH